MTYPKVLNVDNPSGDSCCARQRSLGSLAAGLVSIGRVFFCFNKFKITEYITKRLEHTAVDFVILLKIQDSKDIGSELYNPNQVLLLPKNGGPYLLPKV